MTSSWAEEAHKATVSAAAAAEDARRPGGGGRRGSAEDKQRLNEIGDAEHVAHTVLATTAPLARHLADAKTAEHAVARLERAVCARLDELVRAVPADPVPLPAQVTFHLAEELEQAIRTAGSFTIQRQ